MILEDVLDRMRDELGPGARIVAADRVLKGGLGGFFSKEHYEVTAEVGDPSGDALDLTNGATTPAPVSTAIGNGRGGARVPTSILDLADAMNETERESVIDLDEAPAPQAPAPDGPEAFAQMLERLTHAAGVDVDERPDAPDDTPPPRIESRESARALDPPTAVPPRTRTALPALVAPPEDLATITGTARPPVFRHVARSDAVIERPESLLARLGMPARMIPRGVSPRELRGALVESLSQLPPPPLLPDAAGVVVVVIGPGVAPVVLARDLSEELDLDRDGVVLATPEQLGEGIPTWLQICDAPAAEERRRSWRRRSHPTVVACSLTTGRDQLAWARDMLEHLEPTVTWAIIDAGWKCEDIQHWATALGGIDVLALTNLDRTVSPAAVLELGIPVGRLGDSVASPLSWAELLIDRMPLASGVDLASRNGSNGS